MRFLVLPATMVALTLIAAPSFAQTNTQAAPNASVSQSQSNLPSGAKITLQTQQKLRQSLEQAGFKQVRITPESYVIHAQGPDGSPMVMMVSPDQIEGVFEENGSSVPAPHPTVSQNTANSGSSQ